MSITVQLALIQKISQRQSKDGNLFYVFTLKGIHNNIPKTITAIRDKVSPCLSLSYFKSYEDKVCELTIDVENYKGKPLRKIVEIKVTDIDPEIFTRMLMFRLKRFRNDQRT